MMNIKTLEVAGIYPALQGMRLPMMSRAKSDTLPSMEGVCAIGDADMGLCKRLIKGGSEHAKYLRMIQVWADVDMPRYIWQEMDTYKFGVKNSESTMHTIMKSPITIENFVVDERIKEILKEKDSKHKKFEFKCNLLKGEKEIIKTFTVNGYEYSISNTGQVWANQKVVEYSDGRVRFYPTKLLKISQNSGEYFSVRLGGRKGKLYLIHRLIAENFIDNPKGLPYVNHIDGDKGNCSIHNLEWCTQAENNAHAHETGLNKPSDYAKYKAYIVNRKLTCSQMKEIKNMYKNGETQKEIAKKFNVKQGTISEIIRDTGTKEAELYEEAMVWETLINRLNELRLLYLDTKDYNYVVRIKRILPEGFLQMRTWNTNYAELRNIYHQRKNHRLKEEWRDIFCKWVETLPYAKELIIGDVAE